MAMIKKQKSFLEKWTDVINAPSPYGILPGSKLVACDTETTGFNTWKGCRPYAFSFCDDKGNTAYVEFPVNPFTREVQYDKDPVSYRALKRFFADESIRKIFHNRKFDIRHCAAARLLVRGRTDDTINAVHCCNSAELTYALKPLAKKYADYPDDDQSDLKKVVISLRRKAKKLGWKIDADVEPDYWLVYHAAKLLTPEKAREVQNACRRYAVGDAERTMLLWMMCVNWMDELETTSVYDSEMEFWNVIYQVEGRGVYADPKAVAKGIETCDRIMATANETIRTLAGENFNPDSVPQKRAYFIGKMNYKPVSYTKKTREPSMDKDFLESIFDKDPLAKAIIDNAQAIKARNTYLVTYRDDADADYTIHCSFRNTTATSRLGCAAPNFQNVPKRVPEGSPMAIVRSVLGPRPNHIWYPGDYAQIEARIFADEANETTMLKAFAADRDVYQELADILVKIYGLNVDRQQSKGIFLGKLYGLGKAKLKAKLKVSDDEAHEIIRAFDNEFEGITDYMRKTKSEVHSNGRIILRDGRVLRVDRDLSYKGVNYKIQGNAALLMKRAMIKCYNYLQERDIGAHLVMTIHDELIFEFHKDNRPISVLQELRRLMEDNEGMFSKVKTPVEFSKVVKSWTVKEDVKW